MTVEFTPEIQKLFLEMMMANSELYVRVSNLYNPENFDRSLKPLATLIQEHSEKYKTMPSLEQAKAITSIDIEPVPTDIDGHKEWFFDEFEKFTKRCELERAILKAADLIEKGEYDPVEKLIKDAVQIGLTRDMGTDYFENPKDRLLRIKESNGQISTGWPVLDDMLYGGVNRGELNIFCAVSGGGKSLFMQNISANWVQAGLHGVYVTLELSEELCAMRIDSMLSGVSSRNIFKNIDDVNLKISMLGKKTHGSLRLKYLPAQSTVNQVRAYLKEYQIQTGKKLDFVCVDYLDLLMPSTVKVNPSDTFIKDKYVSEELRNLAKEFNVLMLTCSQLNRSAIDEIEFDHDHIAGGISKINTADNVCAIYSSRAMRERGKYQLQFLKTRNSGGVGQKIDLDFDVDTLRVYDGGGSSHTSKNYSSQTPTQSVSVLNKLKPTSTVTSSSGSQNNSQSNINNNTTTTSASNTSNVPKAQVNSAKLKSMLAAITSGNE